MSENYGANFAETGYAIIEALFSTEEVVQLKAEVARVLAEVRKQKGDNAVKHGVYVGMSAASDFFKQAAAAPRLVAALKQIIGEQVVFLSDKVVFKNASVDFGSPWHQDHAYWKGSNKYSVWIALDDVTPENGCLRILPGSHLQGYLNHGEGIDDGKGFGSRLREEDIDPSQVIDVPAKRGTAIIFHDLLFHASHPNRSGNDRMALISTYKDATQADPDYPWATAAFAI